MTINRKNFYDILRRTLFAQRLLRGQVDGIEAILDEWEATHAGHDDRWLAYMLATAFHETAATMQPVRETLAASDAEAIAILDLAWRKGRLSQVRDPYWRKDADGRSWLGRGLVQLTHRANYAKLSGPAGVDLVAHPEQAMDMPTAVKILFAGMLDGLFTGRKLGDFFNALCGDWNGARKVINGTDRAALVAKHGHAFHDAIRYADA